MHTDDLRGIQRAAAAANLYGLVMSCRGGFLKLRICWNGAYEVLLPDGHR